MDNNESGQQIVESIDFGTDFGKDKVIGGEVISPTARLEGEVDDKKAVERGWLTAMDRSRGNESYTLQARKQNLQDIATAAVEAGIPKDVIRKHLEEQGVKVISKAEAEDVTPEVPVFDPESDLVDQDKQKEIAKKYYDLLSQPGTYIHRTSIGAAEKISVDGMKIRGVGIIGHTSSTGESSEQDSERTFETRHKDDTAVVVMELVPGKKDMAEEWAISEYQKNDEGDFVFPSRHIKGYINRVTGEFVANPNFIPLTDKEKEEAKNIKPEGLVF